MVYSMTIASAKEMAKPIHQPRGVRRVRVMELIFSSTERKV